MVSRDIIQRLLAIINDTRARLNTLESREVALLTATQTLTNKTLTTPTIGNFTNAQHAHTGATSGGTISHSSLTDLTTGDPHTQYLLESVYDANTILKADADDTPIALTVGASTIVGRAATGSIAALTAAQVATIVTMAENASAGAGASVISGIVAQISAAGNAVSCSAPDHDRPVPSWTATGDCGLSAARPCTATD